MIAAMRGMAIQAVFFNRRVFPHERPPLFRMALEAELIHGVGLDHLCAELTMRVMTACTENLPLFQGMM